MTKRKSNIELLQHSLDYAEEYESRERGKASAGRSGTTGLILLRVANDPSFLMHGAGFASVKDEETMDDSFMRPAVADRLWGECDDGKSYSRAGGKNRRNKSGI